MGFYQKIYENLVFPLFEHGKGRHTSRLYSKVLKSQHQPLVANQESQIAALVKLLDFANTHSPYYQEVFSTLGFQPQRLTALDDLHRIPILTKDLIRQNLEDLVCAPHRDTLWRKSTGGSTGQPLHFGYTQESYEWRVAMSKRGYSWAGAKPGSKQAYIWGVNLTPKSRLIQWKEKLHHLVDRQSFFNCFDFGPEQMENCLKNMNKFRPDSIIGYTNPLYEFARFVIDQGRISFQPKGVLTAAEKLHPFQREVIEQAFGCKAFNTYGSREFMLIASECEKREGLHVSMENLIVEIIKDDGTPAAPGEMGKIVITDLHNYGMPFIRYEIGDLGLATDRVCSCGRGLEMIGDVVGRSLDLISLTDGRNLPGEFFPHLLKDFPEVYRFQVVQDRIGLIEMKIVPIGTLFEETLKRIDEHVLNAVGHGTAVKYSIVSEIPLTATGKHRVTISNCERPQ